MPTPAPIHRRRRAAARGFSLVEVALALGIVGFVLAGLIGAIPLASNVGRQSVEQTRAASIAGTVFTTLRTGKFSAASLQDNGSDSLDLNTLTKPPPPAPDITRVYYAYFDETTTSTAPDARRMHFATAAPTGTQAFQVTLRFNNNPPGTLAASGTPLHAQANAVELSISSVGRPKDVYRFSSVIANRSE